MHATPTPENITALGPDEVFVFGSNLSGFHGAGAALTAQQKFGAKWSQGVGLAGQSYAIPTKTKELATMHLDKIAWHIHVFIDYARRRPKHHFWVTAIGCGYAGYKPTDIAPLFFELKIPDNVSLPQSFIDLAPAPVVAMD